MLECGSLVAHIGGSMQGFELSGSISCSIAVANVFLLILKIVLICLLISTVLLIKKRLLKSKEADHENN